MKPAHMRYLALSPGSCNSSENEQESLGTKLMRYLAMTDVIDLTLKCQWKLFLLQEQQPVYADIYHSANPPAAPPPSELKPVAYAAVLGKQSTNSSDAPLSSEYDDIGHQVKVMEEAVQETCPTPYKGQCHVSCYFCKQLLAHVN